MRYEILGPLRVVDTTTVSTLTRPKVRLLLEVLLARADHLTTTDQLLTEMWGDRPPRRASTALHVYVSQLRQFLDREDREGSPIVTASSGYLLRLGTDELDATLFADLAGRARAAAREHDHSRVVQLLEQALELWRDAPGVDVRPGPIMADFAARLNEVHLECVELLGESYLALGRHREVIGDWYSLTTEHPLRETLYRQLMIALYRSERQGEALEVYRSARGILVEELGLEPGVAMQELQRAMLTADARLLMY